MQFTFGFDPILLFSLTFHDSFGKDIILLGHRIYDILTNHMNIFTTIIHVTNKNHINLPSHINIIISILTRIYSYNAKRHKFLVTRGLNKSGLQQLTG